MCAMPDLTSLQGPSTIPTSSMPSLPRCYLLPEEDIHSRVENSRSRKEQRFRQQAGGSASNAEPLRQRSTTPTAIRTDQNIFSTCASHATTGFMAVRLLRAYGRQPSVRSQKATRCQGKSGLTVLSGPCLGGMSSSGTYCERSRCESVTTMTLGASSNQRSLQSVREDFTRIDLLSQRRVRPMWTYGTERMMLHPPHPIP